MRVVSFYSFKGGVGRTMALMNVAAGLVHRGRRVLLVDFDLEAPGIQTYEPFVSGDIGLGVVDYVKGYLDHEGAPKVSDYIREYQIARHSIWLMPAGLQDRNYAARLNSIEWLKLYNEHEGYLMFEDLKQQWAALKFDYVLIDSRTGHTDVAGICTRQLPDAVVLMFLPNDQNIRGLEDVVRNIRLEKEEPRNKRIHLHFCPSNVPDLDDEELILQRHLDDAKTRLKCDAFASVIRHYNSLTLLDQAVFADIRPRTRLADEYRKLTESIISENLEDKEGALSKLDKIRGLLRTNRSGLNLNEIEETIAAIYKYHNKSGEVAWSLSLVYDLLNNIDAQLEALDIAIKYKFNEPRARTKRAQLLLRDPSSKLGREDLRHVLSSKDVSFADLISTIERLREVDPGWLKVIRDSQIVRKLSDTDLGRVSNSLITSSEGAAFAAGVLSQRPVLDASLRIQLILALIGSGQFSEALKASEKTREDILRSSSVVDVFNYGCAEWGANGVPSVDLFRRMLEITDSQGVDVSDANYLQCVALANYVTGDVEGAHKYLVKADKVLSRTPPRLVFSCWRYFFCKRSEFRDDLHDMRAQLNKGRLVPKYMREPSFFSPAADHEVLAN